MQMYSKQKLHNYDVLCTQFQMRSNIMVSSFFYLFKLFVTHFNSIVLFHMPSPIYGHVFTYHLLDKNIIHTFIQCINVNNIKNHAWNYQPKI